ncbi:MAG TPA: glycosyltransferase family 4 protein [Acidobacteriaceae bacterium]|nr:glycosyltransferase family 4 protein [Acidobacteriaceae bacterium]
MSAGARRPSIFMMDLFATVPYYTAYLSRALLKYPLDLTVGSITYYLDTGCFTSRGIQVDPGVMDVVGKIRLPRLPRRILKLLEGMLNLCALTLRFYVSPPDVVHVQYLPMLRTAAPLDLWFLEYCRRRGSKIVLTVHDLLPHDTGDKYRPAFHKLYRRVDAIICHSEAVRGRLAMEFAVPEGKVSVIAHGPFFYDLPACNKDENLGSFALKPDKVLVLWQGIIFPYKGIDLLLRAWQQVEAKRSDACLVIAGTGAPELLQEIRAQVGTLGLKQVKLHFCFVRSEELVALYRAADVVVYPYRAITTSGALASGLAMGKAIVTTDLPVFREMLTHRENALLVAPQDSDALAGALIELVQHAALRERLAANVRAMNFGDESWIAIGQKTMETYERVLVQSD